MLTDPFLVGHVAAKRLFHWQPKAVPVRQARVLLLTEEVRNEVDRLPWKKAPGETPREANERRRMFHALLSRFIAGASLTPNIDVKALTPTHAPFRNLLEFRSGPPEPQTRLFTYVYRPGVWVGCGFHLRSELGNFGDPRWLSAATEAQKAWVGIFQATAPHKTIVPCDTRPKLKGLTDD